MSIILSQEIRFRVVMQLQCFCRFLADVAYFLHLVAGVGVRFEPARYLSFVSHESKPLERRQTHFLFNCPKSYGLFAHPLHGKAGFFGNFPFQSFFCAFPVFQATALSIASFVQYGTYAVGSLAFGVLLQVFGDSGTRLVLFSTSIVAVVAMAAYGFKHKNVLGDVVAPQDAEYETDNF